jgi:hypothetical protein
MKLGDYLRCKKIKQREFAQLGDFSLAAVCNWIHGRRIPSLKNMVIIEGLTKKLVTPRDFLGDDI